VLEAALAGADVCTMYFEFMDMLYNHPLTDVVVDPFLKDYAKIPM
jgi:transaldolase